MKGKNIWYLLVFILIQGKSCISQVLLDVNSCELNKTSLSANECAQYTESTYKGLKNFHLILKSPKRNLPAVLCEIIESSHSYYCGTFSHLHLTSPAKINTRQLMSREDCTRAFHTRVLTYRGSSIRLAKQGPTIKHFILNGSLVIYDTLEGLNPGCQGEGIYVGNRLVPNSFVDLQVSINIRPITLFQSPDGCYFKMDKIKNKCSGKLTDILQSRIILLDRSNSVYHPFELNKYEAPYRTISLMSANLTETRVKGTYNEITRQFLSNDKTFLSLELLDVHPFEKGLIPPFRFLTHVYFTTNIDNLIVYLTDYKRPFFPKVHEQEQITSVEEAYMLAHTAINPAMQDCKGFKPENQPHKHTTLIRQLGEASLIKYCVKKVIPVSLGLMYPCFNNHLTVKINSTYFGITPFSRNIIPIQGLIPVNCSLHPTFLNIKGNQFLTNRGYGMEVIKIDLQKEIHTPQALYNNTPLTIQFGVDVETSMEGNYLESLANDGHLYKTRVETAQFKKLYNNVSTWVSIQWKKLTNYIFGLMVIGIIIIIVILFIYCIGCVKICPKFPTKQLNEHIELKNLKASNDNIMQEIQSQNANRVIRDVNSIEIESDDQSDILRGGKPLVLRGGEILSRFNWALTCCGNERENSGIIANDVESGSINSAIGTLRSETQQGQGGVIASLSENGETTYSLPSVYPNEALRIARAILSAPPPQLEPI